MMKLSIGKRLIIGLFSMLLPACILGVGGYLLMDRVLVSLDRVIDGDKTELVPIMTIQNLISRSSMPSNDFLINGDPQERDRFTAIQKQIDDAFNQMIFWVYDHPDESELLLQAQSNWKRGQLFSLQLLQLDPPVINEQTIETMEIIDLHIGAAADAIDKMSKIVLNIHREHTESAYQDLQELLQLFGWVVLMGSLLTLLITYLNYRLIVIPVKRLLIGVHRFEAGELSVRVEPEKADSDELLQLTNAFNEMADQVENLSKRDELTGLYNRHYFEHFLRDELIRVLRFQHPISLLFVDADHFKSINETYGYVIGDKVIQELGQRVLSAARYVDKVCRYEGEAIAIILPECDLDDGKMIAERVRESVVNKPMTFHSDHNIRLTVSIGVATYPASASNQNDLIMRAEAAVKRAQKRGGNLIEIADKVNDDSS